jgi:hypothetical protein
MLTKEASLAGILKKLTKKSRAVCTRLNRGQSVQVSDTTKKDSSIEADNIKNQKQTQAYKLFKYIL